MHAPHITLIGNIGNDPVVHFTPNGHAVCDLRVANTPRGRLGEEWVDKETTWFTVSCWRELADNVAASLKKGDRVVVTGTLHSQTYDKNDGSDGSKLVVDAWTVAADIRRYPVRVMRPVKEGSSADVFPERWLDKETGEVMSVASVAESITAQAAEEQGAL